jgi:N-acetylmuramoyl-L-alanine amidase
MHVLGRLVALILGLSALVPGLAPAAAEPPVRILDVRVTGDARATQVEIEADKPIDIRVFALDAGARRIVVDLPKVRWSLKGLTAEAGAGLGAGLVSGFQYAHNSPSTSRIVLDLKEPAVLARDPKGGSRITLELKSATAQVFAKAASDSLPVSPHAAAGPDRKPLVVIDPGHGGKDPGALAASGVQEKDITLGIGQGLRDALKATGRYDVAMTRDTDVFIELEDRVEIARKLGAALFISLHADAGARSTVRGASIYTLSAEGEERAEAARERNDWTLAVEADTTRSAQVNDILVDLVQRETKTQSARFAQMLEPALNDAGWPVLQHAHRRRGFFVLLSPDVPAVLLEMGFMTNPEDEALLTSTNRRTRLIGGIVEAIDTFFEGGPAKLAER